MVLHSILASPPETNITPVMTEPALPIYQLIEELEQIVAQQEITLLSAEPGAGKTTQVPVYLQKSPLFANKKIIMTAPRRVAAQSAASYMAQQLGETVGETIGYRVKGESRCSGKTRVELVTTGVLLRMLQSDPMLSDVALIILDEFHERTLESDLILALCRQMNQLFREDNPAKLLIMSATLAQDELEQALDTRVLFCPGRTFPIKENFTRQSIPLSERVAVTSEQCELALSQHEGDLLCFLPGVYEIEQARRNLASYCNRHNIDLRILHGQQKLQEQKSALAMSEQRRVILATSIAETSLTIGGITLVVDSGLAREARFDKRTGLSQLHTRSVTLAEATQRAGRAGRTQAGAVYRCWNQEQHAALAKQTEPEINRQDLASLAYQLIQWGSDDYQEFDWVTEPNASRWQAAIEQLERLGLIESVNGQHQFTEHGELARQLPLAPHLAKSWVVLQRLNLNITEQQAAAACIAFLQEDIKPQSPELLSSLESFYKQTPSARNPQLKRCLNTTARLVEQTYSSLNAEHFVNDYHNDEFSHKLIGALLLGFPSQLAAPATPVSQSYKLANGRQGELTTQSQSPYILALQTYSRTGQQKEKISLFAEVSDLSALLQERHLIKELDFCQWQQGRLINERQTRLGQLLLKTIKLTNINSEHRVQAGLNRVEKEGLAALPWNEECYKLLHRMRFAYQQQPEHWPDTSEQTLLATIKNWLAPYLGDISSTKQWQALPLQQMLLSIFPWEQQQQLDQLVPKYFNAATGQKVQLDYSEHRPTMHIKLQAMFGTENVPQVLGCPVNISLLSPAGRPLAVTANLTTFWQDVYPQVRKEMRGRYPKHPWPEDPLSAEATHKTKRQLKS